mmetsp:Transcript_26841/g.75554  ORF Transcript_26841/g.75554 Transcript_26841/m.75554 type:complete len:246 (+) Transcript_26841:1182-1919(+)
MARGRGGLLSLWGFVSSAPCWVTACCPPPAHFQRRELSSLPFSVFALRPAEGAAVCGPPSLLPSLPACCPSVFLGRKPPPRMAGEAACLSLTRRSSACSGPPLAAAPRSSGVLGAPPPIFLPMSSHGSSLRSSGMALRSLGTMWVSTMKWSSESPPRERAAAGASMRLRTAASSVWARSLSACAAAACSFRAAIDSVCFTTCSRSALCSSRSSLNRAETSGPATAEGPSCPPSVRLCRGGGRWDL